MRYQELAEWVLLRMRMSEVYQPAAIICLIYRDGTASLQEIHKHLEMRRKEHDPATDEREIAETKEMPCDVLVKNKVIREKPKKQYELLDFRTYTPQQLTAIVALCEGRIADWNRTRPIEE
jgi:hypothetical protein